MEKKFGNIADAAAQTTAHMATAKGMVSREGLQKAIGYLSSCGWHPETAARYLNPPTDHRFPRDFY